MSVLPLICCQQMISWREYSFYSFYFNGLLLYGLLFEFVIIEFAIIEFGNDEFKLINSIREERTSQSKREILCLYYLSKLCIHDQIVPFLV